MGLTILLVDDDQILTEKTKNSLNWDSLGIGMVFTANNIHEAKGILKVYKVDILLCDVDMPMGSGLELVEWIRDLRLEALSTVQSLQKSVMVQSWSLSPVLSAIVLHRK